MKIGAHVSAAGGLHNAPQNAAEEKLECFQMFSRPPQGGPAPKLGPDEIRLFEEAMAERGFDECYVHTPYVLNLAHKEKATRRRTVGIIRTDLDRATLLGCPSIMTHLGSASGIGDEALGRELVAEGVTAILDGYAGTARLLLEISAGAGMIIGDRFEEMAEILDRVGDERVGICFDTAHAFASGYDLRDEAAVQATLKEFDRHIGLDRLELTHINDSKVELGTRKDRHEHIGEGHIGQAGFEALMRQPAFARINWILETPDDRSGDVKLLKKMRDQIL
ncbi:deoxyribonuclease IV [Patescibacteria group bacterium]